METLRMEQLVSNFFLLFNLVDATRMARILIFSFALKKERQWFVFQWVSLTRTGDSLASYGECKQHTAPRASITCHTRNFSRRVHVPQDRGILLNAVCVFLENHSIPSMFHSILLDPQLSPHFSTRFPTLAPGSSTSPSLLFPSKSPSTVRGSDSVKPSPPRPCGSAQVLG